MENTSVSEVPSVGFFRSLTSRKQKKKSKYYRMWPVLPSRYLTWPHLLWSLCAPAGSPHLLKHTQQICLGWTLDPICSLRLLQWRLVSPIWPPSASASGINEEVMSLLSSSFGHSSTVTSHCLCSERVTEKENNYEWTVGIKPTAVIHNSAIYTCIHVFHWLKEDSDSRLQTHNTIKGKKLGCCEKCK